MSRSWRTLVLGCIPVLFSGGTARGFDFTFPGSERRASLEITETLVVDYHDDNFDQLEHNDDYADLRNRLNLRLSHGPWSASLRLDASLFISAPALADPPYRNRLAPEKWYLAYRGDDWSIRGGDYYASFGRGLALALRKIDQFGEDTSLMGLRAEWNPGQLRLVLLSGLLNPSNTDGVSEKAISDWMPNQAPWYASRSDWLSGMRLEWNPLPGLNLAANAVGLVTDPYEVNQYLQGLVAMSVLPEWATVAGTGLEWSGLAEWLDINLEFAWLHKQLRQQLDAANGLSLLAGANFYLGDWTLVVEGKYYDDYELYTVTESGDYLPLRIDIVRPPTLEPPEMEIANNRTVGGGRVRLSWRPGGGSTLLEASWAGFWARATATAQDRAWVHNTWLTAEQGLWRGGLARLTVGLREEVPKSQGGLFHQLIYLYASASLPVSGPHSLEIAGNCWWGEKYNDILDSRSKFLKGDWSLGWSLAPLLTASLVVGFDTEPSGRRRLTVFHHPEGGTAIRQVFLAGDIMLNLSGRVVVHLVAGQQRGGARCINGLCRIFPPFAGVKLETTVRF